MQRHALWVAAAAATGSALVIASAGPAASVRLIPGAHAKSGGALAIFTRPSVRVPNAWVSYLARVDPRALQPRRHSPRLVLGSYVTGWTFSPDRSELAIGVVRHNKAFLRFVDPVSLQLQDELALGKGVAEPGVWAAPDRLLVVHHRIASTQVVVVDATARRVVRRAALPPGDIVRGRLLSDGIVLLLAPNRSIGPSTLVVCNSQGNVKSVRLDGIGAGSIPPPEDPGSQPPIFYSRQPGLAVDPDGRRAIVVGADEPVAEVSLDSLAVAYHSLSRPVSLFSRLRNWLEPAAEAKAWDGPLRNAMWLGNGLVAISGWDAHAYVDPSGNEQMTERAAGLQLIDTRAWSVRTLDAGADSFTRAGADLLATGSTWDSSSDSRPGIGLVDYGPDGSQRFTLLAGESVFVYQVFRGRAFVYGLDGNTAQVIDLGTGKVVGQRNGPLPWLLLGDSSEVF